MKHLKEKKLGYFKHMKHAFKLSIESLKATLYFFIHGIYPDVFKTSGSEKILKIVKDLNIE